MRTIRTEKTNLMTNRFARIGLVLVLTMAISAIMPQGWSSPQEVKAANVTYYMVNNNGTSVGADGSTNTATSGTTQVELQWRTLFTTTSPNTAFNERVTVNTSIWFSIYRVYISADYANPTQISGTPTGFAALRSTNTADTYQFFLIDYDPNGAAQNGTVITQTGTINSPSTTAATQVTLNFNAIASPYTIPAGHRLVLEIKYRPVTTLPGTGRVYFGVGGSGTGGTSVVVDETTILGDTLTASGNTAIATSPQFDNATGVVMQRFQVDSNNTDNGSVELNSLTLDDTGTATSVTAAKVYISPTSSTTLPGGAVLLGSISSWPATSTVITLNGGTAGDRTVTNGAGPKYIYIVYDMATGPGNTVRSSVTAVGVAAPDSGAGSVGTSNLITLQAAPVDPSVITSCAGCHEGYPNLADGTGRNTPAGLFPGSHNKHTGATNYNMACTVCHVNNAAFGHRNGNIETVNPLNAHAGSYNKGTSFAQTNTPVMDACSNTYCHSSGIGGTSQSGETRTIPANTSLTWGDNTATCTTCHQAPPNYPNNDAGYQNKRNSHDAHNIMTCDKCHYQVTTTGNSITTASNHANRAYNVDPNSGVGVSFAYAYNVGGGSCATNGCHIDAQWGVTNIDCISCHGTAQDAGDGAPTRRAITTEFSLAWSHKRSAGGAVTAADCIVCHLEGNPATGKTTALHKNNLIDLRNPDTGDGTGLTAFATFSRNTANASLETWVTDVQNNLCLKCHDAGGAASILAQVAGGSALRPFGGAVMNSYNQNVLDVDGQLNTANATFHPVKGPQNNPFATVNSMLSPWNTKAAPSPMPLPNPVNGPQISCWDCHQALNTAHGGAVTLRTGRTLDYNTALGSVVTYNTNNLCVLCHNNTIYGSGSGASSTDTAFGGSNWGTTYPPGDTTGASHLDRMEPGNTGTCTACHSSSWVSPGRPFRSDDAHGGNSVPHFRVPVGMTTGGPAVTVSGTNWTGATAANLLYTGGTNAVYNNTAQNNLSITAWGFPTGEFTGTAITGIGVIIEGNGADANAVQRQIRVNVSKTAGTAAGTWKTIDLPQTTDTVVVAGGPGDLWGTTWTTANITGTGFGVLISDNDTTAAALNLDQVRVVVYTDKWANPTGLPAQVGERPYSFLRNAGDKTATLNQTKWNSWRPRKVGATDYSSSGWGCSWYSDTTSGACSRTGDHVNTWISYGPGGVY